MAEKKQIIKVMTPKGIARFPALTKPDVKYKATGEYKTGVILSQEQAQKIIDKATAEAEKIFEETKAELQGKVKTLKGEALVKAKKALAELAIGDMPFKPIYDDDGNETGDVVLTFKMNAQRTDKKTGKVIIMSPKLFDASGDTLPADIDIWGGSQVKVSGSINPFYIPGTNQCGVSFRLAAVQVIELRSSGGGDASSYGFGKEDGYTAPKSAGADEGFGDESNGQDEEDGAPDF